MTIDPELLPFIEGLERAWPQPPLTLGVQAWRARAEELAAAARVPYPAGMHVEDRVLRAERREVTIRIYRPSSDVALPGVLYMHGGGWVIGSHHTHDAITSALAQRIPAVVASVHYSRAPEHPWPAPLEDCRHALGWLADHARQLGIDPEALFTCGDSAGGNLATVLAWLNRAEGAVKLRGQVLIYPCVDTDFSRPSYLSQAQAPFLKAAEMIWFWDQYCPDPALRGRPAVAPLRASEFTAMAPAFITVAEHDPLRDEGAEYARRLRLAGVDTTFRPGIGLIHGHLRARGICQAAAREFDAICDWIGQRAREPRGVARFAAGKPAAGLPSAADKGRGRVE